MATLGTQPVLRSKRSLGPSLSELPPAHNCILCILLQNEEVKALYFLYIIETHLSNLVFRVGGKRGLLL